MGKRCVVLPEAAKWNKKLGASCEAHSLELVTAQVLALVVEEKGGPHGRERTCIMVIHSFQ